MRVNRSVPRLATVLALAMVAMLTLRCESQESPPVDEPEKGPGGFELLQLERIPQQVTVVINRAQGTIRGQPQHVEICRTEEVCAENQFLWFIAGGLRDGERLVIRGARDVCFDWPDGELVIPSPLNGAESGPFLDTCLAPDKYGFYWPYVFELYDGDKLIAKTDPSGIFRR